MNFKRSSGTFELRQHRAALSFSFLASPSSLLHLLPFSASVTPPSASFFSEAFFSEAFFSEKRLYREARSRETVSCIIYEVIESVVERASSSALATERWSGLPRNPRISATEPCLAIHVARARAGTLHPRRCRAPLSCDEYNCTSSHENSKLFQTRNSVAFKLEIYCY